MNTPDRCICRPAILFPAIVSGLLLGGVVQHAAPVRADGPVAEADYTAHADALRRKVGRSGFHVVVQKPFVVVGDETAATVNRRAAQTVKWAVDRLKRDYFTKDPAFIIDIWLFKDKESYEENCEAFFNIVPATPFGFYSPQRRALIMNIKTGGGTLVHEMVHPFVAANFPECPAWFNEGLASLYEQSGGRDGHIVGFTNWRLRGLQDAIRRQRLLSFRELTGLSDRDFYQVDSGTRYAQARYLCYYLQEKGLLVDYYHKFQRGVDDDPTGYETLVGVLGDPDMGEFQKQWERFVLELRFP